ncbi:hypothetical protein ABVT39_007437 [Epinephelus coioides]
MRRHLPLVHKLMLHNLAPVQIYVGVMRLTGDSLKPDMQDVVHVLLYPDGRQVIKIPGTDDPFTVRKYKEAIGKAHQKITPYICTAEDFETSLWEVGGISLKCMVIVSQISSAATLDELHAVIDEHSSLLQTAGCLQYPNVVLNKKIIIKDFMQWYFIYRNHFSIQRFKDGLSALNVIHALEQHASIFKAFMCSSVEQQTSTTLDNLFEVQLSEQGTTRHQEETRVLAFWRDYLLDTEGLLQ